MEFSTSNKAHSQLNSSDLRPSSNVYYPVIQINGRKVLGPPPDWDGPPPSAACELHIKRIPRHLTENSIIPHLQRYGRIYEFRLMMEFNYTNRGYGFVRYTSEEEADRAMEVLNHFYIVPGKLLVIQRSYDKCRLFVGNIPKHLDIEEVESAFRRMFPSLDKVISLKRISDGQNNRGFVFINFRSHEAALLVKKQVSPGSIRMWGNDLKIVWANPERAVDLESQKRTRTLFVRNVHMSVTRQMLYDMLGSVVKRSDVARVSRVRETAFITFSTRAVAEAAMASLQGIKLEGYCLNFDWALPPSSDSVHSMKNCDYDAVLRLKCIANYWSIPVVIFGRVFDVDEVQYAAVMIRSELKVHAFFVELHVVNLVDIQSRLCEVVVSLINKCGGLPIKNYVVKVKDDEAYIVGEIIDVNRKTFVRAQGIETDVFIHGNEVLDLCAAIALLSSYSPDILFSSYVQALLSPTAVFLEAQILQNRVLVALNPLYRNRPPLKYQIDNRQIVLVLCHSLSMTNLIFLNMQPMAWNLKNMPANKTVGSGLAHKVLHLVPGYFAQSQNTSQIINAVLFGKFQGKF